MTDEEFLVWIANRLVNKYNESRDILDRTIKIISKNRQLRNTSIENIKNNTLAIQNMINYLTRLQKLNTVNTETSQSNEIKLTNQNLLESIDIDNLLK